MVISGVQAKAWGPLEVVVSNAWGDHGVTVWEVIPSYTYDCMRDAPRCLTLSCSITSVFRCWEASNDRRDGTLRIYLTVSFVVSASSHVGVDVGGG